MQCPKCNQTLTGVDYQGVHIETCPACGGDWLDSGELISIVKARQTRFTEQECITVAEAAKITPIKLDTLNRHLKCPKCGGTTNPINYGDDTGLIMDKCSQCNGVWLDRGELEKVQELVEGWNDDLENDIAKYGPLLRQAEAQADADEHVHISHSRFIDSVINGVFDLFGI